MFSLKLEIFKLECYNQDITKILLDSVHLIQLIFWQYTR